MLRNLDLFKEETNIHPNVSLMSYTQPLSLGCRFLEDGMSIVLKNTLQNYVFNIGHDIEAENATSWKSISMLLSSNDELGAQPLLENSNEIPMFMTKDGQIVVRGHLMMDKISHGCDGYFTS